MDYIDGTITADYTTSLAIKNLKFKIQNNFCEQIELLYTQYFYGSQAKIVVLSGFKAFITSYLLSQLKC
jgi:hypothetical protein